MCVEPVADVEATGAVILAYPSRQHEDIRDGCGRGDRDIDRDECRMGSMRWHARHVGLADDCGGRVDADVRHSCALFL
jgi:hypothetical protein